MKLKAAEALSAHEARLTDEEEAHQVQRSRAEDDHDPKPFGRSDRQDRAATVDQVR